MGSSKADLRHISLFSELSDSELDVLLGSTTERHYPKGSFVFYEGDSEDFLLVVLSGSVQVLLLGKGGQEMILATLGPGSFFGEMALLDGASRSATIKTVEASVFLQLTQEGFNGLLQRDPRVMRKVLVSLSRRLRGADAKIRSLSMFDTYGRIVNCLVSLVEQQGSRFEDHIAIPNSPSHRDLAHMIGCSRETVSRAMKLMRQNGYITVTKTGLVVEKRALQQYWDATG